MNDILVVLSLLTVVGFVIRAYLATTRGNKWLCIASAFISLSLTESILEGPSIIPWVIVLIIVLFIYMLSLAFHDILLHTRKARIKHKILTK